MELTDRQKDALAELINIGFSRTAASLSELTGHRVLLDVPKIAIHPITDLTPVLSQYVRGETATIYQHFSGSVAGDALLLLDYEGAVMLTYLLTDEPLPSNRLDLSAREVLTEVGNILLNACLGMFGNLLHFHLSFSVPRLQLNSLGTIIDSLAVEKTELAYALVVHTGFRLRDGAVNGYLVIVLGITSMDRLIQALEQWEERMGQ